MEIELRHLRALRAVADAGSITRAAAVTGTSQPALTATLQRIERAFGGALFLRGRDGVTPTPLGDRVLRHARAITTASGAMMTDVAQWVARDPAHRITVGGFAGSMVIELAERLGGDDEEVSVVTEFSPRRLLDLLAAGRLDVVVVADYPGYDLAAPPGVYLRRLAVEPVFIALATDHPSAAGAQLRLPELAAERWVLGPSDRAGWPEAFEDACRQAGFRPDVAHRSADAGPLRHLIAAKRVLSPCLVTFPESAGITVRPLAEDPLRIRYLLGWRDDGIFGECPDDLFADAVAAHRAGTGRSPAYRRWSACRGRTRPDPGSGGRRVRR